MVTFISYSWALRDEEGKPVFISENMNRLSDISQLQESLRRKTNKLRT